MAHRRRSFQGPAPTPKIKNLRWSGASNTFAAFSAGTSALAYLTAADETETLMRQRGELVASIDGLSSPGALVHIGIGTIVMPEGQSTTVVSSPITDSNAPWVYYEQFVLGYEEGVTDVIDYPGLTVFRKTIDTKAMRVLRPDREMQLVVENITLVGASSVNIALTDRILLGEH